METGIVATETEGVTETGIGIGTGKEKGNARGIVIAAPGRRTEKGTPFGCERHVPDPGIQTMIGKNDDRGINAPRL